MRWLALLWIGMAACAPERAHGDRAVPAYQLACDSSDTREKSILFCLRIDTRTGDVRNVSLDRIPRSAGPTTSAEGPAGTYQLVCDSRDTDEKADLSCIRLNVVTGEVLLVALPRLGSIPE